jgi:hypothetical protein
MRYNSLNEVMDQLEDDVAEMMELISELEGCLNSREDLSAGDLKNIRRHLLFYNHAKYFPICDFLDDLANKHLAGRQ